MATATFAIWHEEVAPTNQKPSTAPEGSSGTASGEKRKQRGENTGEDPCDHVFPRGIAMSTEQEQSTELAYVNTSQGQDMEDDIQAEEHAERGYIIADLELLTDGGYESDAPTVTSTSIAPTLWDHAYEYGRRYHRYREGRYNFPNDDVEQQREDMKHVMLMMLCQRLHFAPIGENPQRILDVGTGTGIWAIEMGDTYPSANILGVDLSPIQPEWVPPNVEFVVDDVESPWLHPRDHFDYIHSRHTIMAIKDWDRLLRRAQRHLRPGGWVEIQEINHAPTSSNGTMPADHPVAQYWRLINEGLGRLGVDFRISSESQIAALMRRCGYANVREQTFQIPIGAWPEDKRLKSVGLYWKTILLDGAQAIALRPLMRGLGWSRQQVETFLASVRRAYHDDTRLLYMPLVCVYGQRPESVASN